MKMDWNTESYQNECWEFVQCEALRTSKQRTENDFEIKILWRRIQMKTNLHS